MYQYFKERSTRILCFESKLMLQIYYNEDAICKFFSPFLQTTFEQSYEQFNSLIIRT